MGQTSANVGLKITSQCERRRPCPVHSGKDPNFAVNAETGLAQCHSQCGRGWDLVPLEMEIVGLDFARAKEHVFDLVGSPRVPWEEGNVEALTTTQTRAGNCFTKLSATSGKN
jgi:DNA primase